MDKMLKPFTHHPESVGESYVEHLLHASWFGVTMLLGAMACLVHAVLPFAFEKTGSRMITTLHDRMVANRVRPENRDKVAAAQRTA